MLIRAVLYRQMLWYAGTCRTMLTDAAICWYVLCYKCCVVLTDTVKYWYMLCDTNRYCDVQDICYVILNMLWYMNTCCVILIRDVFYWKTLWCKNTCCVILLLHLRTVLYLQLTGLFFQTQRSIDLYYILTVDIGLWRQILSSTDQYLV